MSTVTAQPQVCSVCGSEMPHGAYVCLHCKQACCAVCHGPLVLGPTTGRCQLQKCELYSKPVCDNCILIQFTSTQSSLDEFKKKPPESRYDWNWITQLQQKWDRKQFVLFLISTIPMLVGFISVIFVLFDWQDAIGLNGIKAFANTWSFSFFWWIGFIYLVWYFSIPPKIQVMEECPNCGSCLGQGTPVGERPFRLIPLTNIGRWRSRSRDY